MSLSGQPGDSVSIVIPVFNAERYLAEAIGSALAQSAPPMEVIVVDDGSTDGSAAIARRFAPAIRLIEAPHRGLAASRNLGIVEAGGAWLLHLDADDILLPDAVATLARRRDAGPPCDMVCGQFECFISPDMPPDALTYRLPATPQGGHLTGVSLVDAAAFRIHGGLDESFQVNADLEWFVRARDRGARIRQTDDIVMRRRIHGRNMSLARKNEMAAANLRIVCASVARRAGPPHAP
jgi:glycosyltransferase involved in cell wall biosynthesis